MFEPAPVRVVKLHSEVETAARDAFDLYAGRLKAYAYAATRDLDVAEDMVQEVFLRLVRELRGGSPPDNVAHWLFRVASNLVASRGRHRSVVERSKALLVDRGAGRSPEEHAMEREYDRELVNALRVLDADSRLALLMAANGMSSGEIAAAIGRSVSATRTLICRSRLRLRQELERVGRGPR